MDPGILRKGHDNGFGALGFPKELQDEIEGFFYCIITEADQITSDKESTLDSATNESFISKTNIAAYLN
jgi:hypothetical protein